MTSGLRRLIGRHANKRSNSASADAAKDWRAMLRGRLIVTASLLALWVVGIEARLVFLQVIERPTWWSAPNASR